MLPAPPTRTGKHINRQHNEDLCSLVFVKSPYMLHNSSIMTFLFFSRHFYEFEDLNKKKVFATFQLCVLPC